MSLTCHEKIRRVGRVGRGYYEDPRKDVRNKSLVSGSWNSENKTTHGQTGGTIHRSRPDQSGKCAASLLMAKFHRTTPTPTCMLGMHLSCTRVNACITNGHPRGGKARVRTKVGPTSRRAERPASAAAVGLPLRAPDTPTSARDSWHESRRGCPCRCRCPCPCRSCGI